MPINASSAYPNNKNFHKPCFANGKTNDASALSGLAFGKAFEDFPTNFNIPAPLKIGARELLYKLLGDDIFPLKTTAYETIPFTIIVVQGQGELLRALLEYYQQN